MHRRFTEWTNAGVWAELHRLALDELGARGEPDWSHHAIDSVHTRAARGQVSTGPKQVERAIR